MTRRRPGVLRSTLVGALLAGLALISPAAAASGRSADASGRDVSTGNISPPPDGACYRLDFDEATRPTSDASPVACSRRHTAQTIFVGRLDTVVDGHLLAVDSKVAQRQVARTCPAKLDVHLGGSPEIRALSRVRSVWFSPTIPQSDEGASWFRCDAVALGGSATLASLPPPRRLRGILDRPGAPGEVGLCGTAAPGTRRFERVICSGRHSWRAISTIDVGGVAYPGAAAVREAGEGTCREEVRAATDALDRLSYGWEWPTAEQWRKGQRFGFCWAPE